jgi:hypothetical protein
LLLDFDEARRKEGKIMAREILVALNSEDRLGQMIPYIEKIALPGMRVVFLIRFIPQPAAKSSRRDSTELECVEESRFFAGEPEKSRFARENIGGTQSIEEQRLSAEHRVFLALEALLKRGIEISVDVYTGSLRRAVRRYTSKGAVSLIVMRARREQMMMDFLDKVFPIFGSFKQGTAAPVLVFHPAHAA